VGFGQCVALFLKTMYMFTESLKDLFRSMDRLQEAGCLTAAWFKLPEHYPLILLALPTCSGHSSGFTTVRSEWQQS